MKKKAKKAYFASAYVTTERANAIMRGSHTLVSPLFFTLAMHEHHLAYKILSFTTCTYVYTRDRDLQTASGKIRDVQGKNPPGTHGNVLVQDSKKKGKPPSGPNQKHHKP